MAKRSKSESFVEIHELYVIRTASGSLSPLCTQCATGDAVMLAPEHAAAVAEVPLRNIYRWVELGLVHYTEGPEGSLAICLRSLPTADDEAKGL